MDWLHKIRLRVLGVVVALGFFAFGLIAWAAWPVMPVVGVAIITAVAFVNSMTAKMIVPTCAGCGTDLTGQVAGAYGVVCPDCGTFSENLPHDDRRNA